MEVSASFLVLLFLGVIVLLTSPSLAADEPEFEAKPPVPVFETPPTTPYNFKPLFHKPLAPIYKPPIHKPLPPIYKPPVHKPLPPIHKPVPPIYKPPVRKPIPPIYNPPIETPLPSPIGVKKPPFYKPPPIHKPLTPIYKPPPVQKPLPAVVVKPPLFSNPPYGSYPGHSPVENSEFFKPPKKLIPLVPIPLKKLPKPHYKLPNPFYNPTPPIFPPTN